MNLMGKIYIEFDRIKMSRQKEKKEKIIYNIYLFKEIKYN